MIDDHRTPLEILTDYALEKAPDEPLARRVQLYRAIAAVLPEGEQASCMTEAADALENAEALAGQRLLDFRRAVAVPTVTPPQAN